MKPLFNIFFRTVSLIWSDQTIKYSFFSVVLVIIISTMLLSMNVADTSYMYSVGDIAREDIWVNRDIHYQNDSETKMEKKRLVDSVPVVFDRDGGILLEKLKVLGILFGNVRNTLEVNPPIGTTDMTFQLASLKSRLPGYLQYQDWVLLELLSYPNPAYLKKVIFKTLIYVYDNNQVGLLDTPYENPLQLDNQNVTIRVVNTSEINVEVSSSLDKLATVPDIKKSLYNKCYSTAPNLPRKTLNAVAYIVRRNLRANLTFNPEETRRRVNEKVKNVKPVMGVLKKGLNIVSKGKTITTEKYNKITILNRHAKSSNISYVFGLLCLQMVFFIIFGFFLLEYKKNLIPDKESVFVVFSLIMIFMLYSFFVSKWEYVEESKITFVLLLPIPFVAMLISILYNIYLALIVGVYLLFFMTLLAGGGDLSMFVLGFSSVLIGAFVNGNVERRTEFLKGGFILGLCNSIVIVAIALLGEVPLMQMAPNIQLAFAAGIINSILVLGVLPVYEGLFDITTKFKLLELSDLNADIFKQMLVNAPGTYNHSLIVSTMAESACKDIGANHMLARVGAFYHDIGKIEDAGMYIENNKTDPRANILPPTDYSRLIISHVSKGVGLAKKHRLPDSVIDFIKEHHGQSTMTFFYHQALEEAANSGNSDEVEKSDFRYPGPKPCTRETAVVMLGDAIEAASRSLQEPSSVKLEGLVRKIIYNKLNDGELENSDLSMSDLAKIQKAFLSILNGIFHTRIEYPEKSDVKKLEKKVKKGEVKRQKIEFRR
ncbi:MAG: HDIG domain-containing protein [bacterium]|nr:HDIG domain-containing protein [bacterium]